MTASPGFYKRIGLWIVAVFLICGAGWAQPDLKKAGVSPSDVLERASKRWDSIKDFQCVFSQIERQPNGDSKTFVVHARLVQEFKNEGDKKNRAGSIRIDLYKEGVPISAAAGPAVPVTPVVTYYLTPQKILYTYKPDENTFSIEWLDEGGALPEFLQLAGLADFDMEKMKERVYVNENVYEEEIMGVKTYRLHFFPKEKLREVEPDRLLWLDQETYMPKQFEVVGDLDLLIQFRDIILNRGLSLQSLVPKVPENVRVYDLR
ncbi:MAG: hypothetical protein GC154_00355 [bacterium]|nr:hypothetical protein [bacterium]